MLVRASPKSAQARVVALAERADGRADLKIALKSAPEGGHANAELLAFLAKEWEVPKRALTLVAGAGDRRKAVLVAGEPEELLMRLESWLARWRAKSPR